MKRGHKKSNPQWFAFECPCFKGKLILHTFSNCEFVVATCKITEELSVPKEYMNFTMKCQKCHKTSVMHIAVEDMDWFLDRLTPNVTQDPCLREKILWYWDEPKLLEESNEP